MKTDDLIRAMAADTPPARPVARQLAEALLAGALLVALVALPLLGLRADWAAAMTDLRIMPKQALPLLLAVAAFGAATRLARPDADLGRWRWLLAAVPVALGVVVASEMAVLPRDGWQPAMMGETHWFCLGVICLMAGPLMAGILWALRGGASTRPRLSGATAGLLAGSTAATLYAIHCTEDNPLFYAAWYGLAILLVTAAGALGGGRLLRW